MSPEAKDVETKVVVVAPDATLHKIADPFAKGLYYAPPDRVLKLATALAESVRKLRISFSGREFSEAGVEFSAAIRNAKIDVPSLRRALVSTKLKES
jgi:hypothetical protein